jgi:hypothetical protein
MGPTTLSKKGHGRQCNPTSDNIFSVEHILHLKHLVGCYTTACMSWSTDVYCVTYSFAKLQLSCVRGCFCDSVMWCTEGDHDMDLSLEKRESNPKFN